MLAFPKPTARPKHRRPLGTCRREAMQRSPGVDPDTWTEIRRFYGGLCAYCGERAGSERDHVVPVSKGGLDEAPNVVPSCPPCNGRKGARTWEPRTRHPWMRPQA